MGNALLAAMIVGAIPGIVIPQFGTLTVADPALLATALQRSTDRYGEVLAGVIRELDMFTVFTSWWWTLIVILFSVSLLGNTVARLPRLIRDIRTAPVRRGRAFFRSSIPARTGPLDGLDGSALPKMLRAQGYRIRKEVDGGVTHLLAERNRWSPLATLATHGALLLFVVGMGFVTPRLGYETLLKVPVGEGRPTGFADDPRTVLVQNDAFVAKFSPAGAPTDFRTTVRVFRNAAEIARKTITVNDPLSIDGWVIHENFFGPAVEMTIRDDRGLVLYAGSVLLDGQLGGKPEGQIRVPGSDLAFELLLQKGADGIAELAVIGVRGTAPVGGAPDIALGAVLRPGEAFLTASPRLGIEFRKASSYIGLIAKRDPGQWFIWIGSIILVIGVAITLLRPRRRIWARYDATTVRLAVVGGDPFTVAACAGIVAALPTSNPASSPVRAASNH